MAKENSNPKQEEQGDGAQKQPANDGAKGTPDPDKAAESYKAARDSWKQKAEAAEARESALQKQLDDALTSDDVKKAVEDAKAQAKADSDKAASEWSAREKRMVAENRLLAAGCIDSKAAMAHVSMDEVEVASDGHVSGLDIEALRKDHPYLFSATQTVSTAGKSNSGSKTLTASEINKIKNPKERLAARQKLMGL